MKKTAQKNEAKSVTHSNQVMMPTRESILAEARALGSRYPKVNNALTDVLAEAREMKIAASDLDDLLAREYPVTRAMFARVDLLCSLLTPHATEMADDLEQRSDDTAAGDEARQRLIAIRERLAALGDAVGLDASIFTLDYRKYGRLYASVTKMVEEVQAQRALMPDKKQVDALLTEAMKLIDQQSAAQKRAAQLKVEQQKRSQLTGQLKRLLVDQMKHLSKQGIAAYPGDANREVYYRLERLMTRPAKATSEPNSDGDAPPA